MTSLRLGRSRLLVLAPHLDDAVFSVGGLIAAHTSAGGAATVATVFSECTDGPARRAEDAMAAGIVGARPVWLGFADAPLRAPEYRTFEGIVFGRARTDRHLARRIATRVAGLVRSLRPSLLVAPLGVGGHIDHRLVHEAAEHARPNGPPVVYYADRPYDDVAGARALRLASLGAGPSPASLEEHMASFTEAPYVRTYLSGAERAGVHERIASAWSSAAHEDLGRRRCRAQVFELDANAQGALRAAITAYGSQRAVVGALDRFVRSRVAVFALADAGGPSHGRGIG